MELKIYGDPVLRKRSVEVDNIDSELITIADEMFKLMKKKSGIGLAAPQVGIARRFIAVDYIDKENESHDRLFLINPVITASEGTKEAEEGCLSIPGFYEKVKRDAKISVRYLDLKGNSMTLTTDTFLAVILQHEIDHLNGVLFVDHLSRLKREVFSRKWNKIVKSVEK